MPLSPGDKANFETLQTAALHRDLALMECQLVSTGEAVAVICAVNRELDQSFTFVPLAQLFIGDPYSLLNPPHPDQPGFAPQEDVSRK